MHLLFYRLVTSFKAQLHHPTPIRAEIRMTDSRGGAKVQQLVLVVEPKFDVIDEAEN